MPTLDERLIDPSPELLVKHLVKATRAANGRKRLSRVEKTPEQWQRFVKRNAKKSEGHQRYAGSRSIWDTPVMLISWWTDHLGRRHWRLVGQRAAWNVWFEDRSPCSRFPLWRVHPERTLVRRRGENDELLVACRCGMVGRPADLGWTGTCCGPCRDLQEDGMPPLPEVPLFRELRGHRGWGREVAFIGNEQVVTGGSDGRIIRWDLAEGTRQVLLHRRGGTAYHVAASSAGHVAANTSQYNLLLIVPSDPDSWLTLPLRLGWLNGLTFSPSGGRLLVTGTGGALLFYTTDPAAPPQEVVRGRTVNLATFLDEETVAFEDSETGVNLYDLHSRTLTALCAGQGTSPSDNPTLLRETQFGRGYGGRRPLACSRDRQWLAWEGRLGTHLWHLPTRRSTSIPFTGLHRPALAMGFTADGLLVAVGEEPWLRVFNPKTNECLGTLLLGSTASSPGTGLSADAETFTTTCGDGTVRLWPWRRFLSG